ncbi:MAG: 2TM domain-containing protein [Flavobacteriaceae bacterium]|nr:2TM domain-containing protein [Flavobacteriaceae bacterium]
MKKYEIEPYKDHTDPDSFAREEAYLRAKKKLDKLVGFYWHLAVYVIINIFLIILIGVNLDRGDQFWSFGTFATALFWGIGLAFHFLSVFGPGFIFGKNWEDRKIKEYMDKDRTDMRRFE